MTTSALVGYARTSTTDQKAGLEAQLRDLEQAGCTKVFREEVSSVATNRPQLAALLEWVR
ncbi:MAG: recombinase family protein, partial [Mesorhizobium sp.]